MSLLSYQQAAERLGLSVRSLQRLVDAGRIPAHRIGPRGGRVRFDADDLETYLKRCRKVGAR